MVRQLVIGVLCVIVIVIVGCVRVAVVMGVLMPIRCNVLGCVVQGSHATCDRCEPNRQGRCGR